ncbi:MAG: hypothetical protein V4691_04105 [Pseudomonadota bacterium]
MSRQESYPGSEQDYSQQYPQEHPHVTRQELRRAAWDEYRAIGERARAGRYKPDVYTVAARLGLGSQGMAERLLATRRLDARLSLLIPQQREMPPPTAADIMSGDVDMDETIPQFHAAPEMAHPLSGDKLMQVTSRLAAAIDCLNRGALIGREELRDIARDYGEAAMRFGLKFRSAVPVWMLELLRSGKGGAMQLAATAVLVWSEIEGQPLTKDLQHGLSSLNPVPVQTLDDPQETVELVRLALTASNT